ncbi:MAG: hypothetical protein KDA57_17575, partial [Planctomycetales bacterium]|nr:hypothetical protein [Planctomycetales bacterium]
MHRFKTAFETVTGIARVTMIVVVALAGAASIASLADAQAPSQAAPTRDAAQIPFVRSYRVLPADEPIIQQLLKQFAGENQFRHIHDRPTSQWVVVAPPQIHEQIAKHLQPVDEQVKPRPSTSAPPSAINGQSKEGTFRLQSLTARTLHTRLENVLGRNLPIQQDATGQWDGFNVDQQGRKAVTIWANKETGEAQISGTADQIKSWRQVVTALDSPPNNRNATRVVATEANTSAQVKQAVGVLQKSVLVAQKTQQEQEG